MLTPKKLLEFPYHLQIATAYFILEYVKDHFLLPGQIENWILVVDCLGCEIKDYFKKIVGDLLTHYPCRLAKAFIFNSNRQILNLLKILTNNTLQKITIIENESFLMKICNPQQVEIKFGGTAKNCTAFWPPVFPCSNYRAESDPVEGFLSGYSSYEEHLVGSQKIYSDISSLKLSQNEEKDSFISNSDFKDEMWQKLDVVSGSFSFLQTDNFLKNEFDADNHVQCSRVRKSDDLTRTSSNAPKKTEIEQELIEPSCCIEYACVIQ